MSRLVAVVAFQHSSIVAIVAVVILLARLESKLLTSSPRNAASSSTAPSSASTSALSQIQRSKLFLSLFQPFLELGSLVLGDLVGARISREILSLIFRLIL